MTNFLYALAGREVQHDPHVNQHGGGLYLSGRGQSQCAHHHSTLAPVGRFSNSVLNCILQGTVLCDIILLNFLKGAEQYKAKKFEEVSHDLFFFFFLSM